MKEQSIHRMNFLRHGRSAFTYRTMIYGLAAWCLFLIVLYGLEVLRFAWVQRSVEDSKTQLAQLNEEKDRQLELMRTVGKKRGGTVSNDNIASILAGRPRWSGAMRAMIRSLPADVWLDGVNVTGGSGDEWYSIRVTGKTKSQRALTTFIMQLENSGYFRQTALTNTKLTRAGGAFQYELTTQPVARKLAEDA